MKARPYLTSLLLLCSFFASGRLFSQPTGEPIIIGEGFEIHSDVLSESRPYLIGLPDNYQKSEKSYPVLYLLDGDGHFQHTTGTVKFLARNGRIPEMIVVALPNTADRTHDLTPPILKGDPALFPTAGGADNMLRFISDELMPYIEKNYRTSSYKVLIGHSFGGLFAIHTMVHRPEMFNAFLAISPSLWWDEQELVTQARTFFMKNPDYEANLYMTMGNEDGTMLGGAWKLAAIMEEKAPAGLTWEFRRMEEETHGSIPHRSTYYGLEKIFTDWKDISDPLALYNAAGMKAIDAHYRKLEEKFGLAGLKAPENLINRLGYQLLGEARTTEAIVVFRQNVENYPKSANVYDSLGEAYQKNDQHEESVANYKKSLELNPGNENAVKKLAEMGVTYQPEKVVVPKKMLESYVGKYNAGPNQEVLISLEDGRLFGKPNNAEKVELVPMTENKFYLKNENIQLTFEKSSGQKVDRITVNMRGQEVIAKRVE